MKKAFSLVEISITVLIIGILIAGIIRSSNLYDDFKLANARKLTLSSQVGRTPNLLV